MTLDELNALDQAGFTDALGGVFEHSPWIASATWEQRPFADVAALTGALLATMRAAAPAAQLALIRAHPDLAGKAALAKELTAESTREQAGAGLDRMSAAEYALFHRLNDAYRQKFEMPFIICVRHHDKASILAAFERRLGGDREGEVNQALSEIGEIARLRLADMVTASHSHHPDQNEALPHG